MSGGAYISPASYPQPQGFAPGANQSARYAYPAPPLTPPVAPPPIVPPPVLQPPAPGQATPGMFVVEHVSVPDQMLSEELKEQPDNNSTTLMVTLCALLFFLVSLSVIGVVWIGAGFDDPVTETNDQSDVIKRGPSAPKPPLVVEVPVMADNPVTVESTTTTVGSRTPTARSWTTTVGPRTTTVKLETTPTDPKAQGPETLLCTYGQRTTEDAAMAEDGLCDYAFYDSMYANDKNTLVDQGKFGQDLQTFMRAADRYNSTALGLAFAFEHIGEASAHLRKAGQYPLETFWRMKIFHVGVLDASDFSTGIDMQVSIWLLKVIHDYASAKGHTVVTALAAPSPERHWAEFLADLGRKLGYYTDILIVHGHYRFGDNTVDDCAVMPPTRYSTIDLPDDLFESYRFDLEYAPSSIREFQVRNYSSRGLVSVTMKGRWTWPSGRRPVEFYTHCDINPSAVSFGSYAEVCSDINYGPQIQYKSDHYAVLTHHTTLRRAFAYDNEEGLCAKLCKVKDVVQDVSFGIAAYDVDFDDYANECSTLNKFGPHSRLKALRKIVDYYKTLATDDFDEKSCTSVVR